MIRHEGQCQNSDSSTTFRLLQMRQNQDSKHFSQSDDKSSARSTHHYSRKQHRRNPKEAIRLLVSLSARKSAMGRIVSMKTAKWV